MNDPSRLQELFSHYQQRRCTAAEVEELIGLLQQADAEEALSGPMQELWSTFREHATEYPRGQLDQVQLEITGNWCI